MKQNNLQLRYFLFTSLFAVTSSSPVLLKELITTLRRGMVVHPEGKSRFQFYIGADKTLKTDVRTLKVVDVYNNRYLVGNPVTGGK